MKKLIIAISSMLLLAATSAVSMELRPAIGISGNMGVFSATGTEKNYDETGTTVVTTTDEHGAFATEFGSIFIEMGVNDTLSIGVDYVPQTLETPQNVSNENGGSTPGQNNQNTVEAHFEDLTTV